MRVAVTGAAGFIGNAVAVALRARGDEVLGLDQREAPGISAADVTRPETLDFSGIDLVVHTAAVVTESADQALMWRVNVDGTTNVLLAAARAGVPRVVHLSSIVVHGPDFADGVDETGPVCMTGNPYTDTKVAAEHQALLAAARGQPVSIVRPGDVYGPGSMPWTLRPIELMRAGRFALIDGGRGVLSPTYVDDLVAGILAVATHPAAVGEVFHVTGGSGVPAADFFGRYAAMLGIPKLRSAPSRMLRLAAPLLERLPLGFSPRAIEYLTHPGTYSIEKARRLLGWEPQVSLDDGMARTEQWLRERGLLG